MPRPELGGPCTWAEIYVYHSALKGFSDYNLTSKDPFKSFFPRNQEVKQKLEPWRKF